MGKAAAAAGASVVAGMAAFVGLASFVPVAWAEGVALILTGSAMLGASFFLEPRPAPRAEAEVQALPSGSHAQEA